MAKILVVDDHSLVRQGIVNILQGEEDGSVCGQAANGQEAIDQCLSLNPDLVLMDITMPVMNGIEATRIIRKLCPMTKLSGSPCRYSRWKTLPKRL